MIVRDRLEEVRVSGSSLASGGARRLSASCSSASLSSCDESCDEVNEKNNTTADSNFYEAMKTPTQSSRVMNNISQRQKLATPSPVKPKNTSDPSMNDTFYSSLSSPVYSTIGSPQKSSAQDLSESYQKQLGLDYHSAKLAASEMSRTGPDTPARSGNKDDRRRSRTDLKKRLKQLALTSETGSASVIEVIEPNSSEEEEFMKSMQEMRWNKAEPQTPLTRSRRVNAEAYPSPAPSSRASKTSDSSGSGRTSRLNQSHHSIVSHDGSSTNHMPATRSKDLHQSQRSLVSTNQSAGSKNLLRSEPDILAGVRHVRQDITADSMDNIDTDDDLQMLPYDLDSDHTDSSLQQMKKKGFLQKLSIFQKKKPGKSSGRSRELAPEYFKETYLPSLNTSRDDQTDDVEANRSNNADSRSKDQKNDEVGITRIAVGASNNSVSPTSRKSTHENQKDGVHVTNSDDSGIIARPISSASKSDASLPRPESSSSDQPMRPGVHQERNSPIGSDQRKSADHQDNQSRLSKIKENAANQNQASSGSTNQNQSSSASTNQNQASSAATNQMTTIITLKSNNINNNNQRIRKSSTVKSRHGRHAGEEKPWYDVSDEDVDIQTPEHITSIISVRGSSDEDPF